MKKLFFFLFTITMLTSCTEQLSVEVTSVHEVATTETTTVSETITSQLEETTVTESNDDTLNFELMPNMRILQTDYNIQSYSLRSLGDGKIFAGYYKENDDSKYLLIYDTETDEEKVISLPQDFYNYEEIIKGTGDDLYVLTSSSRDFGENDELVSYAMNIVKIKTDYSVEYMENATIDDVGFDVNGHRIAVWDESIYSLDYEPRKIIEGIPWDTCESKSMKYKYFKFPIDENHFVFHTSGYEWSGYFSIYDFTKNEITFNSDNDRTAFGSHNNKIYSIYAAYAEDCSKEIYVTDANTFETSIFMEISPRGINGSIGYICMSPDGKYIACDYLWIDDSDKWLQELIVIDVEKEETIATYNVGNYTTLFFTDNDTLAVSNGFSKTILIDIQP